MNQFNNNKSKIIMLIIALSLLVFLTGMLFLFKENIDGKNFLMYGMLAASYYAFHNNDKIKWQPISRGTLIGIAAVLLIILLYSTFQAIRSNEELDFMCFYMQGQLGVHHLNFYDPNSFQLLLSTGGSHPVYSKAMTDEILNVGLLSPPITMLFFDPLAHLPYETSRTLTAILSCLFIFLDTILSWRLFFKKKNTFFPLLFVFILIMLLPGTLGTIFYVQTNFFLLFFLLCMLLFLEKKISGVFLALSMIIKPIPGVIALYFLLQKKLKSFIAFCVTGVILVAITAYIWGFDNIYNFFKSPPTDRLPAFLYYQKNNEGLLAILNRSLMSHGLSSGRIRLIFYAMAILIIIGTCLASKRLQKINSFISIFPFFICMLLIYPSSLTHYSVYLVPVLLYLLLIKNGQTYFWIIIIPFFSFLRTEAFFSYLLLWLFFIYIAWYKSGKEDSQSRFGMIPSSESP